ncbi:hypothetical protein HHI36_009708, partial [Cryptolaemus montrouzieri]
MENTPDERGLHQITYESTVADCMEPTNYFGSYFSEDMITEIVNHMNEEMRLQRTKY